MSDVFRDWSPPRPTRWRRMGFLLAKVRFALFPLRACETCRFAGEGQRADRYGRTTVRVCRRFPPTLVQADPRNWESRNVEWRFPPLQGVCGEWRRRWAT